MKERWNVKREMEGMKKENAETKWVIGRGNHARRKGRGCGRLQRGNSSEKSCRQRAEYRGETQETEAGRKLQEGGKERIEKEGLIVNGRVVLKNPKMYVGMKEREACVCV